MNEFDKVGLYEHNAESYRKVREAFKENNVVGIVHATGTGKSYNALQLAYDNKDLKSIWVVPSNSIIEHIKKTINDNPNLDMERDFANLEFRTYQSFINMNTDELEEMDIDMLILDEFHHTGAPVWGSRIDSIIETHPDIKVFGMTAYTVRDRGTSYERDMALDEGDELFSDNIVSRYDLCDAMIDGVLPNPIYKSSYIKLIDMTRELEERVKKLEASGRECSEYNTILNDVKKRLHEAPSLGETVKKNIKKNGKYIYFCPPASEEGTNDIETIKKEAISWFKEIVPEEDIVIYTSLSEMEDGGKSNRDSFYDDLDLEGNKVDNKLRVMFAINQYNEGVHAPNLDGVIMGRGTCSDIVFFEQLGRALSVSSGVKEKIDLYSTYSIERLRLMCSQKNINYNYDMNKEELIEKLVAPVIIDLAGNIDFIKELEDNLKDRIKEYQEKGNGTLTRRFLSDASFDLDTYEVDLFNILMDLKQKTEMTWDDWYKLAEEYYKEHRDLAVPLRYKDENGYSLGLWVRRQRVAYENRNISKELWKMYVKPLTDEQLEKLESIGMIWDSLDSQWNEMYELVQKYYEEHGNLNVPIKFVTESGKKLGNWISNQRVAYKKGILSKERIAMLDSIEMVWNAKEYKWSKMYGLARQYYEEHGNLEVPQNYITSNGEKLGIWISIQKQAYKNRNLKKNEWVNEMKPLTDEQVSKLESIGMVWNAKEYKWSKMYSLARQYYEEHRNLEVPQNYITSNGEKLGNWISIQKQAYKNRNLKKNEWVNEMKPLTDAQVIMLESIGMVWNQWTHMYNLAQKYYEEHGNLEIPQNYITSNGEKLGIWVQSQRQAYENRNLPKEEWNNSRTPLTDEQVSKLESIGMVWNAKEYKWSKMYGLARQYYEEHGNLEIPQNYITSNGEKLGIWVQSQRQAYENRNLPKEEWINSRTPLTDEQVSKLELIGMIWNVLDNNWNKMYELVHGYYEEHGNLNIPKRYILPNGERLGSWVQLQRTSYKKFKLSDEQIAKLESIGMIWEPKKNKSDIRNLCENKDYGIDIKKNKDIINHISFTEFKVKIAYLKDNGINIVDENGILHEIFSMSSMNMKLKYNVSLEDLVNMYNKGMNK